MAEKSSKVPVKTAPKTPRAARGGEIVPSLASLRQEMGDLFDRFTRQVGGWPALGGKLLEGFEAPLGWGATIPSIDVVETDKAYEVSVELPGLTEKDFDISIANGVLTIKGEKKEEFEEKKKGYYRSERRYGAFERLCHLPANIDESKIDARLEKGVLRVSVPKIAEPPKKSTKIEVKTK